MSETATKEFAFPAGMFTFRALLDEKMKIHEAYDLRDELGDLQRRFDEPLLDELQAHEDAVVRLMSTRPAADLDDAMAMLAVAFERLDVAVQPGESGLDKEDCRHAQRLVGAALRHMLGMAPDHSRLLDASVARLGGWFGSAKAAEPDPLVELERRYGELLDGDDDDFDAAGELLGEIVEAPLTSVTGVAVMARILLNSTKAGRSCWDEAAASAILEWAGRQTGRNEFIGATNFEKVGVEPVEAEARP